MRIEPIRVNINWGHYQPERETKATIVGLIWDNENKRPSVVLLYDNGFTDWIPLSEISGLVPDVGIPPPPVTILNK